MARVVHGQGRTARRALPRARVEYDLSRYRFFHKHRGRAAVAIHCSISYLKAVQGDLLLAEAEEVSCGPKIAAYTIRITDDSGEMISLFEGMAYRKGER